MGLFSFANVLLGLAALYVLKKLLSPKRMLAPLPPGPKGMPLIGNIGDLPPPGEKDWKHWAKFKKLYGRLTPWLIYEKSLILHHKPIDRPNQLHYHCWPNDRHS